jgi:hypothetical protein
MLPLLTLRAVSGDHIGGLFGHHDNRGIRVAADPIGEREGIDPAGFHANPVAHSLNVGHTGNGKPRPAALPPKLNIRNWMSAFTLNPSA